MEEKIQYGFWDQIPIAFLKPDKYKEFLNAKRYFLMGFMAFVVFLSVLMQYIIPIAAWNISVGGLENLVTNGIPEFTLKNGVLDMKSPIEVSLSGMIHIVVDTSVDQYKEEDLGADYIEEALLSKNNVVFKHQQMSSELRFADYPEMSANNQTLVKYIPYIKSSFLFTLLLMFVGKYIGYLIVGIVFAFLCCRGLRSPDGTKRYIVPMREAFIFAIYARSLFMLLNYMNACLGYFINDTFLTVVGVVLTMQYIYRAERSYLGINNKKNDLED